MFGVGTSHSKAGGAQKEDVMDGDATFLGVVHNAQSRLLEPAPVPPHPIRPDEHTDAELE